MLSLKNKFLLAGSLFFVGCLHAPFLKPAGDPAWGVDVRWLGHSSFLLTDGSDRSLLLDPFDDTVGYPMPNVRPDAVLITHDHFDHDYVPETQNPTVRPDPEEKKNPPEKPEKKVKAPLPAFWRGAPIHRSTGTVFLSGVTVHGVLADHDGEAGQRNGTTRIFVWEMGGVRFSHLGDIGQTTLRPDQLALLAGVDVLFVPVGGKTTVDAVGALTLVQQIHPRVVVPMHYGNRWVRFFVFDTVTPFLKLFENVTLLPSSEFCVKHATLTPETRLIVPALPTEGDQEVP